MIVKETGDTFNCDCGFSWLRGKSGNHDCGDGYRKQIVELREKLAKPVVLRGGVLRPDGVIWYSGETVISLISDAGFEVKP